MNDHTSKHPNSKTNDSESDDDPLIEIPNLTGTELVKKSQMSSMDIRSLVVRCTSCFHQINHHDKDKVKKHPKLDVLMCRECQEFYGSGDFSQDESGSYNYCTWCGNGGTLFICDFCPNGFCNSCVRRNLGRAEVSEMNKEGWKCYVCDSSKLKAKVAFCDLVIKYTKSNDKKKEKRERVSSAVLANGDSPTPTSAERQDCILPAFERCNDSCKSLMNRLEKLKLIETSQSKSLRHIIKKMEDIIASHKTELSQIMKSVSRKYTQFLDKQKKAEELRARTNSSDYCEVISETGANGVSSAEDTTLDESKKLDDEDDNKDEVNKDEDEVVPNNVADTNADDNYKAKMSLLEDSDSSSDSEKPKPSVNELNGMNGGESKTIKNEALKSEDPVPDGKDEDSEDSARNVSGGAASSDSSFAIGSPKKSKKNSKNDSEKEFDKSNSESLSDTSVKKPIPEEPKKVVRKFRARPVVDENDPKLKLKTCVVLEPCDSMLPVGETTITLPKEDAMDELERKIASLSNVPKFRSKPRKTSEEKEKPPATKKLPKKKKVDSSSSSICLTSSDESESEAKKKKLSKLKTEDANALAKKKILESDDSLFSSDSEIEEVPVKKKKGQKSKVNSDSSEDFQPRKKLKYDKLLSTKLLSDDDDDSSRESTKKTERKKGSKRKQQDPGEKKERVKRDSDSEHTTSTDSEVEKQKKKRKRIKKPASSSEEDADKPASQSTPGKGRKNIQKIISSKKLAVETKEAQNTEKERRKRVQERQKLYNVIMDQSKDGVETITRKMVLEVDPDSKEEIVQIHPDLVEKLKLHQVNGVKFMWECTIESLKELETGPGSGCILAHCMGLGKTLQVITFLHTCLTNKFVNKHIRTAMVICPYNTVLNWSKEFEHWLEKIDGEVIVHQFSIAKDNFMRLDILEYWQRDGGVLIISYDIFRRFAMTKIPKMNKKNREKIAEYLLDPGPDIIICDEGHMLKNVKSAISQACAKLKSERRVVLTGTPLQNNLLEYHCMLSFVKPHLLGTPKEFRNRFINPIMNGQYEDSDMGDVRRMKKRIHILHKLLEGCVQRCDYSALTKFLPPKHEFVISVKLSDVQIKMYQWYLDNLSRSKTQAKIQGGTLFMDFNILRNLCTHPYIVHTSHERLERKKLMQEDDEEDESFINDDSPDEESGKSGSSDENEEVVKQYKTRSRKKENGSDVEEVEPEEEEAKQWYHKFFNEDERYNFELSGKMMLLFEILKECEAIGDKVIIFSQSILTLDLIEDLLEYIHGQEPSEQDKLRDVRGTWAKNLDYFRMDGTTSAEFRKNYIDMFNSPKNDRARLFLVSTRAGGLGTNLVGANRVVMLDASWNPSHDVQAIFRVYRFGQKKPVYIYRLLAQGTMEEKIYDRQVTKLSLSIRVVDEQQIDRHFNAAELAELYKFEPDAVSNRPTPMVPKDTLLAEMLIKLKDWIVTYHEHDSLLQNETEEDLTEEERKAAWTEYENEREGRNTFFNEQNLDENMQAFCKEPDFTEVEYEGTMIPSTKSMIESIITDLKIKHPAFNVIELRKKLMQSVYMLRTIFQEKHVRILRMKQEYLSRGSVPSTVNKYLEELNIVLKDLGMHYENVQTIVMKDAQDQLQARLAAQQAQQAQMRQQAANLQSGFFPGMQRAPFQQPNVGYTRLQQPNVGYSRGYNNMNNAFQARVRTQGFPRPGTANLPRYTFAPQQRAPNPGPSKPVITEVDCEEVPPTTGGGGAGGSKSSVVITEVDD